MGKIQQWKRLIWLTIKSDDITADMKEDTWTATSSNNEAIIETNQTVAKNKLLKLNANRTGLLYLRPFMDLSNSSLILSHLLLMYLSKTTTIYDEQSYLLLLKSTKESM